MKAAPGAAPTRWRQALRRWRQSLKGRLLLLFVLLALGTTAVFMVGMQRLFKGGWQAYASPLVSDYVDRLAAEIGSPPNVESARAISQRLPIAVRIDGPTVQFDSHPGELRRHFGPPDDAAETRSWGLSRRTSDGHRLRFSLAAPLAELPDGATGSRWVGWATLATLLGLTALAYLTVRRLLRPLQDIGAGVQAFGAGRFEHPIAVRRADELGELATRINAMAASLHGMLDAKRALLLAMSHELRSPLTRARLNAELLDDSPERSALLHDLGEMRELIAALLEGERLADGHTALQREPLDLPALVRETAAAHDGAPRLTLELAQPAGPLSLDPTRLRLLLRNLIDNALRHGGAATAASAVAATAAAPVVFLRREADGRWALGVRDHGPGVLPEQIAQLAQAFYRPDSARTRDAGGVGLGLYLCRLVAQAHGGELRLRNAEPGLEVAMVWAG